MISFVYPRYCHAFYLSPSPRLECAFLRSEGCVPFPKSHKPTRRLIPIPRIVDCRVRTVFVFLMTDARSRRIRVHIYIAFWPIFGGSSLLRCVLCHIDAAVHPCWISYTRPYNSSARSGRRTPQASARQPRKGTNSHIGT